MERPLHIAAAKASMESPTPIKNTDNKFIFTPKKIDA